jgi:hypothetical protein
MSPQTPRQVTKLPISILLIEKIRYFFRKMRLDVKLSVLLRVAYCVMRIEYADANKQSSFLNQKITYYTLIITHN